MKITVTHEFANHEEATAHFVKLAGQQSTLAVAAATSGVHQAQPAVAAATLQPGQIASQPASAQINPAPAAHAATGDVDANGITREAVKQAFVAYVQKPGSGHTALTGLEIIKSHGLAALKDARPEQFLALKNAFDTAP